MGRWAVTKDDGQISSRPHEPADFPQKGCEFWKGNGTPAISGKSRLVKYHNLARHEVVVFSTCEHWKEGQWLVITI